MRLLPSTGWIGGLFGRRDRALLTVAAHTQIPYRQIAGLTVGQLHIAGGVATITDRYGAEHLLESDESPVLCGPCALVRWRRLLDITVATKTRMSEFLTKKAKEVTEASHHPCRAPQPIDPKTLEVSLFPPIDQWGHLAVQIRPLTPRSVSRLARQAETGLAAHRTVPVDEFTAVLDGAAQTPETPVQSAPVPRPVWDWAAANEKKNAAIAALAPLTDMLDDIDARINELAARAKQLERRGIAACRSETRAVAAGPSRDSTGAGGHVLDRRGSDATGVSTGRREPRRQVGRHPHRENVGLGKPPAGPRAVAAATPRRRGSVSASATTCRPPRVYDRATTRGSHGIPPLESRSNPEH